MSVTLPWSRRKALLEMPPDAPLRVWTLQHPSALAAARERGWLSGEHAFSPLLDGTGDDYAWMREQMRKRIPDFSGDLPVWCWPKRPSGKPLSACFGPTVRIAAIVPRRRVLPSDFGLYTDVMNGQACTMSEAEDDERRNPAPTWERIFDLAPRTGEAARWKGQPDTVQLCVDRIMLGEILSVTKLASRPPRPPLTRDTPVVPAPGGR